MLYQPTRPVRRLRIGERIAAPLCAVFAAFRDQFRDGALLDELRPDELRELGLRKSEAGRFERLPKEPTSK